MSVRASTVVGMTVMEMMERTKSLSVMVHGIEDDEREMILASLVEKGWERRDSPDNHDGRGARDPQTGAYVVMWPPHV